ncbi:hypothetical protein HHL19_15085 [Streptomyces sp. R302]|uniref:hypothetical protein n=1 Tax=unclassified Streptomyces TaxID=2593676 RepID=UPI00145C4762|nr:MULTISPECIES: hypothetical protein [unclassified Streptomyces]NML51396.1 hypothetical protein [Streptomyces sp. R301]NML79974.1 hypothetical protein [Streptomyces sp. R302]
MSPPAAPDPDPDSDRRARLLIGDCFGAVVAGILPTVVAMLLMSVAITGFSDRDGGDSRPVPTAAS